MEYSQSLVSVPRGRTKNHFSFAVMGINPGSGTLGSQTPDGYMNISM